MGVVQMELFPKVTEDEKQAVKLLLKRYPKMSLTVEALRQKPFLTPKQQKVYQDWGYIVEEINTAFGLILDEEVKKIFEHRYIKGQGYMNTIDLFWSKQRSERTIDRRISIGVETIAEHLKLCDLI